MQCLGPLSECRGAGMVGRITDKYWTRARPVWILTAPRLESAWLIPCTGMIPTWSRSGPASCKVMAPHWPLALTHGITHRCFSPPRHSTWSLQMASRCRIAFVHCESRKRLCMLRTHILGLFAGAKINLVGETGWWDITDAQISGKGLPKTDGIDWNA